MNMTPKSVSRIGGTSRPVLLLLMAICFLSHLNRLSMAVAGDERIMPRFGISPERMGVIYSAFLLVYSAAMFPAGLLIDRWGPAAAWFVMGVGSGLCVMVTGFAGLAATTAAQLWLWLVLVRGVAGLMSTPLHPGAAQAIALWIPPPSRTLANGLVTGAALLGIAASYHLFGFLIDHVDWPMAFLLTGAATVVVTMLWFRRTRGLPQHAEENDSARSPTTKRLGKLLQDKSLIFLTLSYAAVGYFQYLFFYWIHYYFEQIMHLSKNSSRNFATLPTLAMALAMPLGGWISDAVARRRGNRAIPRLVPISGMAGSAGFLVAGLAAERPGWVLFWFTLSLASVGLSEGSFWLTATAIGKGQGGTAAAVMNTGGNGIGLLAPWLTPVISERFGWHWGLFLGAVVALLGALCWFWIRPAAAEGSVNTSPARPTSQTPRPC